MKEVWSKKGWQQYLDTLQFIYEEFGRKAALTFKSDFDQWRAWIVENPTISPVEPLLISKNKEYRSRVISKRSKLVYYVEGDSVRFVAVWDMRRNPDALVKGLK